MLPSEAKTKLCPLVPQRNCAGPLCMAWQHSPGVPPIHVPGANVPEHHGYCAMVKVGGEPCR